MHNFIVKRSKVGMWGYGATVARVTPDHKVGSSNLSGLISGVAAALCGVHTHVSACHAIAFGTATPFVAGGSGCTSSRRAFGSENVTRH